MSDKDQIQNPGISNNYTTDLIQNYKDALESLVPTFEKADIKWKLVEMYDDFDGICESLYQWMVAFKLENEVESNIDEMPKIAKYGYLYKDYKKTSFIEVIPNEQDTFGILVFVHFKTAREPFDTIFCSKLDFDGNIIETGIDVPFKNSKFRFQYRKNI